MKIWFDMDGTIADLYGVNNWLNMLIDENPAPYEMAKPLVNMARLARKLNSLQKCGYEIGIISWLSKTGTDKYNELVTKAKIDWLARHMPSVKWNEIKIVPYGTNKWVTCRSGILFDDEARNRDDWQGNSYEPIDIFTVLAEL